jgi:hypothetical protein
MRRVLSLPAVLLAVLPAVLVGTAACSGSSTSAPPTRGGNPADTASPTGTLAAPTPQVAGTPTQDTAPATAGGIGDLPACMIGTWTAPVAREFDHLNLQSRTSQTVRGATGVLNLVLAANKTWTFTYDTVRLQMPTGTAEVSGPISGTWSLSGNTLSTTVAKSTISAKINIAGARIEAPGALTGVLNSLPPNQTRVTCTGSGLQFALPSSQGGGTVTFDKPTG